jgi:hypothetical protein
MHGTPTRIGSEADGMTITKDDLKSYTVNRLEELYWAQKAADRQAAGAGAPPYVNPHQ